MRELSTGIGALRCNRAHATVIRAAPEDMIAASLLGGSLWLLHYPA